MGQSGKILVICAPSGTGKSTLIKKLKKQYPEIEESVSYTTRPRREKEIEGKDYFYIPKMQFEKMIKRGDFLEYAQVHSNYYGTSKDFVHKKIELGSILLFDLDVQGADFFKNYFGNSAKVIFIEPPSLKDLEKRLRNRGTDQDHVIEERLRNAKEELQRKNDFDYLVTNQDFDKAYEELCRIFDQELKGSHV